MSAVLERPHASTGIDSNTQKLFFQVFLGFKKPDGTISFVSDCNVYERLGAIFKVSPGEIHDRVSKLVYGHGDGFMQEYLSLEEASNAVAQASLFSRTAGCVCFLKQEAYFRIKEINK